MNAMLWWLAQDTITIALLIPIVAVACRVCRNRPAVQHVLWAVVLLKFITPPLVCWPWPVQHFGAPTWSKPAMATGSAHSVDSGRVALALANFGSNAEPGRANGDRSGLSKSAVGDAPAQTRALAERAGLATLALGTVTGIWFLGFVACTARQVRRIGRHAWLVRVAKKAPEPLITEIEAIAGKVGLRPPRALVSRGIVSPFMWFLGRLSLVWPETMSGRDDVIRSRGVIAHELAHVHRGDHYLAWVELFAGLVWWWNPLFWCVRRRVRETAELACDAIALSVCPDGRRTYAELLLELSSGTGALSLAPVLGIRAGTASSFERRLSMILSDRVSGRLPLWGFVAAGALALVTLPAWSVAQNPVENAEATSGPIAGHPERSAKATAARLEQIEAELKRLSGQLEEAKRTAANPPQHTKVRPQDMTPSGVKLNAIEKDRALISLQGTTHNYFVTTSEGKTYLSALEKDGRQIWHNQLPIAHRAGDTGEWKLKEYGDQKLVVISWVGTGERNTFHLDASSGKTITELIAQIDAPTPKIAANLENAHNHVVKQTELLSVVERLRSLNTRSDHINLYERDLKLAQTDEELTRELFHSLLNRNPTPDELTHAIKHFAAATKTGNRGRAVEDIFWVIINSAEHKALQKPQTERR